MNSPDPRRLAVLTTGRQDYGILRSSLLFLRDDPRFALEVWVGGMHLKKRYGHTVDLLAADGLEVARRLDFLGDDGDPGVETARAVELVARALADSAPDALVLLGDRSETLAAGVAASLAGVPIAHLHGGEETEGAVDNAFRHALTKLSHLHLVSHEDHARRVRQMGEPADTVVVVGAAGLDNAYRADLPSRAELEASLSVRLPDPLVLVTVHPTTLGTGAGTEVAAIAAAMERVPATYLITAPNADAGGSEIRRFWGRWSEEREGVVLVEALGEAGYWTALRCASAVLGNSSSGIIEAPALGVPVVNVGDRQRGRLRYGRVQDVPADADAVASALGAALTAKRRAPDGDGYPAGPAAPRIVEALAGWRIPRPPRKRFVELECRPASS